MTKKKKILISVISIVLVLSLGLGIWYAVVQNSAEPVGVYPFQYLGMTEYWGDNQESYGPVTTDKIQTVYLSETQTVTEILVSEGDEVKKGDLLMTFDTTLSDLALERKRLDVEKLKLQLTDAQQEYWRICAMKPMVIHMPEEGEEEEENLGTELTAAYQISSQLEFDGSSSDQALICWLHNSSAVNNEILEAVRVQAETFQRENAVAEAESDDDPETTVDPEEIVVNRFYVVFKVTKKNMSLGQKLTWQGVYAIRDKENGTFSFQFFDASAISDHMLSEEEAAEDDGPKIEFNSGFTAAQIYEMRIEQEKRIKELEFNIKMAEADYKIMLTEAQDGNVYAQIDGTVVSLLSEEEAKQTMQPVLKVSGGGGFYIEGSVSELEKDNLQLGQEVTINDWNTGMTYTGTVSSIGDFPSSMNSWNGMGNPNASYYPFFVFVDESADLQAGRYVNMMYSTGSSEHGIYLENPFLRTEMGRTYVYLRGADSKLEKRYVTTGKSLWGSYTEILEGITEEDFIAFPYGKHVKEGAETVESDLSDLYG